MEKHRILSQEKGMRICVAGGAGLTGQCAVRDLLRSKLVSHVLVADFDSEGIRKLRDKLRREGDRVSFEKVDIRNHDETASIFKGYEMIINAVQYYYNLDVMAAALKVRANYIDFGGLFHTTKKQIEMFASRFRSAELTAIVGMGAQPGVSNLMVKHALKGFDRADSIEIFDGWRDLTKSDSPIYFTWSPLTFFDESSKKAVVFEKGSYVTKPPFSDPETIDFPAPVGKIDVYTSLHSELATLPSSFRKYGLRKVVWKEGGADFWKVKFLSDLGLTSAKKISFNGTVISPRDFFLRLLKLNGMLKIPENCVPNDYEVTRVVVKGLSKKTRKRKTTKIDAHFPSYKPWKVSCSQYNVGIPGSIAAQKILSQEDNIPKGVLPPEMVFEPVPFFDELKKRGISVVEN